MENSLTHENTFHIGITMAGAISAGCYTAGVMDYLFEILHLWEEAKTGKLPEGWNSDILHYVPQHNVVIDAMGGASAGGMTTVMSAIYALNGKINPVKNPENPSAVKDNLLYDSWVLMNDEENDPEKIFERTLALDDLQDKKIKSLLNSGFIDKICENAFKNNGKNGRRPSYISDQLEILLSQTMLRSVPLTIDFATPLGKLRKKRTQSNYYPRYNTFDHFVISHFKLDYDHNNPLHQDFYLPFTPYGPHKKDVDRLKLATIGTGAFPIGLGFRNFFDREFTPEYIKNNSKKLLHNTMNPSIKSDNSIELRDVPDPFQFVGVDGGVINNEPIGEVLTILKERYGHKDSSKEKSEGEWDYKDDKFGMIMIDPFPDHIFTDEYKQPEDIISVIPSLVGTLMDQSRLKRKEIVNFNTGKYLIGEIFPVRNRNRNSKEDNAIACSSVFAFGGFLDINFRHHDFFLGRNNSKNFFKIYFSFEYDPANNNVHFIHKDWTPEMVEKFKYTDPDTKKIFLPIIPDLNELNKKTLNPIRRTVNEWPEFNPDNLIKLQPKLEARVKQMSEILVSGSMFKKDQKEYPAVQKIMETHYKKSIWSPILKYILKIVYKLFKGKIAKEASRLVIEMVLKDLEDKKLIKISSSGNKE